eukprot:TRINITY_DN3224_c0_g1_i1.p1 TRINITY_DN3224_c0_g1~~TRINITY_DN3224_c0_g1_i1.p1  ORF type:complete len:1847 (-),score=578.76 TRINITY_DN3224_c0_g1_i1:73-5613(-)
MVDVGYYAGDLNGRGRGIPPRPPAFAAGGGAPGAGAGFAAGAGVAGLRPSEARRPGRTEAEDRRDHLWEVLHQRDQSASPRGQVTPPPGRPGRRESRSVGAAAPGGGGGSVSPGPPAAFAAVRPGWEPGGIQLPAAVAAADYVKGGGLLRRGLLGIDAASLPAAGADTSLWLERRLNTVQSEQRAEVARRFESFEQSDRRFKEWVQREQAQLGDHVQQVKAATHEGQQQQQRQAAAFAAQAQRLELKCQELETTVAQAVARADGLAHALQGSASAGPTGAAAGNMQAAVETLRADLERETSARAALASESSEKIKELHGMLSQVANRQEQDAYSRQQTIADERNRQQARLAVLEPGVDSAHSELEALREQLRRSIEACNRRCEEVEATCVQRIAGVQEAALNGARELWEEHHGVVGECKTSLASLQQILESKDKITAQLQSMNDRQREDDKQEILVRLQHGLDSVRASVADLEAGSGRELGARSEAQQKLETHVGRLGLALEKAQESWVRQSERLTTELRDTRRQVESALSADSRGHERRLAEAVDAMQRKLDEMEPHVLSAKGNASAVDERVSELVRGRDAELMEAESRLKRLVADVQAMALGKIGQCEFDLRAAMRTALAEQSERQHGELVQIEQAAADERGVLRSSLEDLVRESERKTEVLREEVERRLSNAETASTRRATQATEACAQLRADLAELHRDARGAAERAAQEAKVAAEALHGDLREDLARQASRSERACADLARDASSMEERLTAALTALDGQVSQRLTEELRLERERNREDAKRLAEEERSARLQAETERLSSLQKRLLAHEDLTTKRLGDMRTRLDDAHATTRQNLEAKVMEDRSDLQRQIEDLMREQKLAAMTTRQEVTRLDGAFDKLVSDVVASMDSLSAASAEERRAAQERIDRELASFSAKLGVALAGASASLAQGLGGLEQRMAETETRATEGRNALRQEIQAGAASLTAAEARWGEALAASAADLDGRIALARGDAEKAAGGLREAMAALEAKTERNAADLAMAMEEVRRNVETDTAEAADRLSQLADDVRGVEEELLARAADVENKVESCIQSCADSQETFRQELETDRRHVEESRAIVEQSREQLEKVAGAVETAQQAASDAGAKVLELTTRLDEVEDGLHREAGQARAAEAALQQAIEERDASQHQSLADGLAEVKAALESSSAEAQTALDTQAASLEAEKARAEAAEAEIRSLLEDAATKAGEANAAHEAAQLQLRTDLETKDARAQAAETQLRDDIAAAQAVCSEALAEEVKRAQEAEEGLRGSIEELAKTVDSRAVETEEKLRGEIEALRSQSDAARSADSASRAEAGAELRAAVDAAASAAEDARAASETELRALIESSLNAAQDARAASEAELRALIESSLSAAQDARAASEAELRALIESSLSAAQDARQAAELELRGAIEAAGNAAQDARQAFEAELRTAIEAAASAAQDRVAGEETRAKGQEEALQASLDKLREAQEAAVSEAGQLAQRHEEERRKLAADLAEASKAIKEDEAKLEDERQRHASEESASASKLQAELAELRARVDADVAELRAALDARLKELREALEGQLGSAREGLEAQLGAAQSAATEASKGTDEEVKKALEELRSRQGETQEREQRLETSSTELATRLTALEAAGAQQEKNFVEQSKFNMEIGKRQDATISDLETISGRIDELTARGEASAQVEEQQARHLVEMADLREQLATIAERGDGGLRAELDAQAETLQTVKKRHDGLEEQMGAIVQTAADALSKVDSCAKHEDLKSLRAHTDGALDAMLLRLETERWMHENFNGVADGITNSFLGLLDQTTEKLQARVRSCEDRLQQCETAVGAGG